MFYLLCTMKGVEGLRTVLEELSDRDNYLFSVRDFSPLLPDLGYPALKALLSRAVKKGVLERVCHGVFLNPRVDYPRGKVLYHTVAKLRGGTFNYLSLESALSDAGVISQVPVGRITVMSRGRSHQVSCGQRGLIEFIHTKVKPEALVNRVIYDFSIGMWRATVPQALLDMKKTRRSLDLIDETMLTEGNDEFV